MVFCQRIKYHIFLVKKNNYDAPSRLSPTATTAPTTRATSPFPAGAPQQQQQQQQQPKKELRVMEINNPTLVSPVTTWEEVGRHDDVRQEIRRDKTRVLSLYDI